MNLKDTGDAVAQARPIRARPLLITVLAALMLVAVCVGLAAVLIGLHELPVAYRLKSAAMNAAAAASAIGLLRMRKWGYWLYVGSYLLGIALYYLAPLNQFDALQSNWISAVWLLVFSGLVLPYWKRLQ